MSGENPYAAPQTVSTGLPDAPESFGWELAGKRVWAEKFAQFPMVDPYSGESEEVMTMNRLTVRHWPLWMTVLRWICIGVIFLPLSGRIDRDLKSAIALVGVLGLIATMIVSTFFPITGLKVFFTKRTLRMRAIQHWVVGAFFVVGILSGMKVGNSGLLPSRFPLNWISGVSFGIWILGLIWKNLILRRLTCRRRKDGHFEIRGFHSKALELLALDKKAPVIESAESV